MGQELYEAEICSDKGNKVGWLAKACFEGQLGRGRTFGARDAGCIGPGPGRKNRWYIQTEQLRRVEGGAHLKEKLFTTG